MSRNGGNIGSDQFGQAPNALLSVSREFIKNKQSRGMGNRLGNLSACFVSSLCLGIHR